MNIEILTPHNSIGFAKYLISIDGVVKYKGRSNFFLPHTKFKIFDLNKNLILKIINKRYSNGLVNHQISLINGKNHLFKSESYLEHSLFVDSTKISFYEQKGHDVGIFVEDEQIGFFTKNKKYRSKGNVYTVKLQENKINYRIIIGCILAYDGTVYGNERGRTVFYSPGNVSIKPIKLMDKDWEP